MKKTVYVNLHWNKYNREFEYRLATYAADPGDDYVTAGKKEVEFDELPDQEARKRLHASLIARRAKVLADAHVEAQEIAEMAQELLAIEYKGE